MTTFEDGRNWILAGSVASFIVATFLVFEAFELGHVFDASPSAFRHEAWAALGILLLTADVVLPVPSSLVMLSNGAVFGVAAGAVLSMIGRVAAFTAGYLIGALGLRRFGRLGDGSALRLLSDRAWVCIVVTRPVPVLSETVAIMTGAAALPFARCLLAAFVGSIPESIVLAAVGSSLIGVDHSWLVFPVLAVIVAVYWAGARLLQGGRVEHGVRW